MTGLPCRKASHAMVTGSIDGERLVVGGAARVDASHEEGGHNGKR